MSTVFAESAGGQFSVSPAGSARNAVADCLRGGIIRESFLWIRKWYSAGHLFPPIPPGTAPDFTDVMDIDLSYRQFGGLPGNFGALRPFGRWRIDLEFTQYYPLNPNAGAEFGAPNDDFKHVWLLFFSRGPGRFHTVFPGTDIFSGSARPLIPASPLATALGPYAGEFEEFTDQDNLPLPLLPVEFRMFRDTGTHTSYKIDLSSSATPGSPFIHTESFVAPAILTNCYRAFDLHVGITQRRETTSGAFQSPIVLGRNTLGMAVSQASFLTSWQQSLLTLPEQIRQPENALPFWQIRMTVTRLDLGALFKATKHYQGVAKRVRFEALQTGATSYSWNFGDGTGINTAATPTHDYAAAGDYTVTLTVTNALGDQATHSAVIHLIG